jgi:hypothetical protein
MKIRKATFSIGNEEYEFKDLTIKLFYELQDLLKSPDREAELKIVSIMTECPIEELKGLKFETWLMLWAEAQIQITASAGDADTIRPTIEFNGTLYGLPKLEEITVGEFADLDVIATSPGAEKKLVEIAAILYRPVTHKKGNYIKLEPYTIDGYNLRLEEFQELPVSAIRSANAFFLQSGKWSLKNTLDSLMKNEAMTILSPQDRDNLSQLLQQEIGGSSSTDLLGKILLDLKQLQNYRFALHSTGLLGKKTRLRNIIWPFNRNKNII